MYKDVEKDVHAVGLDLAHADLSKPSSPQHRVSLVSVRPALPSIPIPNAPAPPPDPLLLPSLATYGCRAQLQRSSSRVTRDDFEEIGRLKETLEGIDRRL